MKRYLSLFLLCGSLAHAETDLTQDIYETIVETMLTQGATTLVCPLKATYTIDLGMNKRVTEDNGEKTIVLYIGDLYIFERVDGVLENLAYRETTQDAWETFTEDTTTKVSEASIISNVIIPQGTLNVLNETSELDYKSWRVDTSISRYTGSYSKISDQVFTTPADENREVSRTDNYVGTCTKADKAKF